MFTTSSDIFCSKCGGVWEMLWIFKVARWTHDRCKKINKRPTVSSGVRASSFDLNCKFGSVAYLGHPNKLLEIQIWRFRLESLQSHLPRRHPKNSHSDADISWSLFLSEKNQNQLDIYVYKKTCHCIHKLGKIQRELKFLLYTGIIWHSYFPLHGISWWKGSGRSGAKWVKHKQSKHKTGMFSLFVHSLLDLILQFICL